LAKVAINLRKTPCGIARDDQLHPRSAASTGRAGRGPTAWASAKSSSVVWLRPGLRRRSPLVSVAGAGEATGSTDAAW